MYRYTRYRYARVDIYVLLQYPAVCRKYVLSKLYATLLSPVVTPASISSNACMCQ